MAGEKRNIVLEKSFKLALKVVELHSITEKRNRILADQFLRSATSVGANVNEAQAAISKKEFIAKISIGAKEIREAKYWWMLLTESKLMEKDEELEFLIDELIRLTTSIVKSSQQGD
jgi:four helix bundle protein